MQKQTANVNVGPRFRGDDADTDPIVITLNQYYVIPAVVSGDPR